MLTVGVISDTHGLVRPEALEALRGAAHILHAGDVGGPQVLEALQALAPVTAVRGNNDRGPWAEALPDTAVVELAGASIYLLHDRAELDLDPRAAGMAAVVCGHSHKPLQEERDGVLHFNPGSAGPAPLSAAHHGGPVPDRGRADQRRHHPLVRVPIGVRLRRTPWSCSSRMARSRQTTSSPSGRS
jgi:putative phosphoesterase